MVGKELVVRKEGHVDLREVAAMATLREVRQKGHPYVELRRVGKRVIFFCTICLTECFSDNALFDHLKGSLHSRRYAEAKVTLFGPMPWPFNDGVLFFNNSREKDPLVLHSGSQNTTQEMALVARSESSVNESEVTSRLRNGSCSPNAAKHKGNGEKAPWQSKDVTMSNSIGTDGPLVIPGVLLKEVVSNLAVHLLGFGNIGYRTCEANEGNRKVSKLWCAWVGKEGSHHSEEWKASHQCNFAIVNFSYTYDLGRKWGSDDQDRPLSPGSYFVVDDAGHRGKRRKKSFSDQEASSEESNGQCTSRNEGSQTVGGHSVETLHRLQVSLLSKKSARLKLRKHRRLAAERACDICGQPMLHGKDVATLLNCETGNLACSSRNTSGAFHLFHTSCLVNWTLLCEYEILADQISNNTKSTRGRRGRTTVKNQISSVLCPECQGTGTHVEREEFEKPTISLSEMFRYKLKAIEAHKAWMKSPEVLENCSTGLYFPADLLENSEEKVIALKLLHFYAAEA